MIKENNMGYDKKIYHSLLTVLATASEIFSFVLLYTLFKKVGFLIELTGYIDCTYILQLGSLSCVISIILYILSATCLGVISLSRSLDVEHGKVIFLGDSITEICNLDKYYPTLGAVNRGISGAYDAAFLSLSLSIVTPFAPYITKYDDTTIVTTIAIVANTVSSE